MSSPTTLAEPLTPEWFAQRRLGIGASEIAAVMGISPWESPFSLYWRKVNGWELEVDPEMEWGNRLEPAVAVKFADSHPELHVAPAGLMQAAWNEWMLATPDRLIADACPCLPGVSHYGNCTDCMNTGQASPFYAVLELKTAYNADGWGEAGTDDIPVHYRAQVQWQMAVVDANWATLAVLIGGSDYREYTVLRDTKDIRIMVEHGRRFMARIEAGDPPPLDGHAATLATVKRLHPDLDDTEAEIPASIAAAYRRACDMERKAKSVKKRYETLLRAEMGRSRKATTGGSFVASRSVYEVAEHAVKAHTVDRLNPPRAKKETPR